MNGEWKGPGKAKGIPIISTDREISGYFSLFFPSLHILAFQVAPFIAQLRHLLLETCWSLLLLWAHLGSVASPTDSSHESNAIGYRKRWRLNDPTRPKLRLVRTKQRNKRPAVRFQYYAVDGSERF